MMELLKPSNTKLNLRSREIETEEISSQAIKKLLSEMRRIAIGEPTKKQVGKRSTVGLSAPQLGMLVRVILVDLKADPSTPNTDPDLKIFINPRIIASSEVESIMREGCWSTGEICGAVSRPDKVTVSAIDEQGKELQFVSSNPFQSHILQHEIDHLDGIRFPSRIRDPKKLHMVARNEFQDYRENWMTWKKLCPVESWLKIYNGENSDANI